MILTGYTFDSADSIKPFLEEPGLGVTSRCCKELATRLGCHVIAGYPEKLVGKNNDSNASEDNANLLKRLVGHNSAVLFNSKGLCGNYRKTNLFDADKPWALPGDGFATFDLGNPLGRISIGICMDLNPAPSAVWTSIDEGPYEIAEYTLDQDTNLLVILCAWLDSGKSLDSRWDISTMNYWLMRLYPLWMKLEGRPSKNSETIVVMCNRCGIENAPF
ncbi:hypothetical protein Clacol_009920 [Clathrus columnatus]|uniref:CN hydrolase domain-containing protein n=1 Tax=Clathrus columnatus TaxID=1419009 RepID=A0AAV5APE1_9AGAM|nr:hypothetical protein Clacol_009920 [Clathrus columnatus]